MEDWLKCQISSLVKYHRNKLVVVNNIPLSMLSSLNNRRNIMMYFIFCSVRLLSVLRGHSGFSSPPQRPMTSDFEGFSIPDFIHYIYSPILILEKEPVFPFLMLSAKQGNYLVPFYNVFGMTSSLTGDWTRDLPHSMPALYHWAIEEVMMYWIVTLRRTLACIISYIQGTCSFYMYMLTICQRL